MSYDDEMRACAFESGYELGHLVADTTATALHLTPADAFDAGQFVGLRIAALDAECVAWPAEVAAGRSLAQRLSGRGIPAGLDSDAACVWISAALYADASRLQIQDRARSLKPSLTPRAVDEVRRDIQAAGHLVARRVGRSTVYNAARAA